MMMVMMMTIIIVLLLIASIYYVLSIPSLTYATNNNCKEIDTIVIFFLDAEAKVQRCQVTYPRPHRWSVQAQTSSPGIFVFFGAVQLAGSYFLD